VNNPIRTKNPSPLRPKDYGTNPVKKGQQREILAFCDKKWKKKTLISTATMGWIRYEWAYSRYSQIVPMNWEASGFDLAYTSIGYNIDDAYNCIVKKALDLNVDWLITIEDDVLIPADLFLKLDEYQAKGDIPIISGLYYLKAEPTLPLIFRGRGNSAYTKFKIGDKVWCDGLPMGCLMIHTSILKWMWDHTAEYKACDGSVLRKVFETPQKVFYDPESQGYARKCGTQDLYFFDQLLKHDVLSKTGWKEIAKKQYPFLCDTSLFCRHIDRNNGRQYP
jgi:hypothetical protein